jgi:SAM-dependent methyltransferase
MYDGVDRLYGVPGRWSVVRCTTCGLAYTLPRPSPADLQSFYPENTYVPYQESSTPLTTVWQRVGARGNALRFAVGLRLGGFRALIRAQAGRLLDVGCGRGDVAEWFGARGWRIAGVEPSEKAATQAAKRGVEVHHGTLDDAPWEPASFDAVTFNHVLEHVPEPRAALRQSAALLKPGGLLVVSAPNFGAWQRRAFGPYWFPLDLPRHLQHFDRHTLPPMVVDLGLEIEEVRTSSLLPGLLSSVQYALKGRLFLSDVAIHRAMHLTYPLVLLGDFLFREADCLHVVARRR